MSWKRWWEAIVSQVELFWGKEPAKLDIPWREYFDAGLSPSDACRKARDDGWYTGAVGGR